MMLLCFIHVVTCIGNYFLFIAEYYSIYGVIYSFLFILSAVDGIWVIFNVLAIMNNAAINIHGKLLWGYMCSFFLLCMLSHSVMS